MTKKETDRISRDFNWLAKNTKRIQNKYSGKWIAVVNGSITGFGSSASQAYKTSKKRFPEYEPLLDIVPTRHCLFL
jgi:hypothetical protein